MDLGQPHNVFLSASAPVVAKLGDFGLTGGVANGRGTRVGGSKEAGLLASSPRSVSPTLGGGGDVVTSFTPRYAAPEIHAKTPGAASQAADVYSFGLVAFETICLLRCRTVDGRRLHGFEYGNSAGGGFCAVRFNAGSAWVDFTYL